MNLFLDTQVLLWWLDDSRYLCDAERKAIADPGNLIVVSAAVIWEIRIKQALGKLENSAEFYPVIKDYVFVKSPNWDGKVKSSRSADQRGVANLEEWSVLSST